MVEESSSSPRRDDTWIEYKRQKAVELVWAGYSVEWAPNFSHWIQAYLPCDFDENRPEVSAWAKFYMEPSEYGIDGGRVSKLCIQERDIDLKSLLRPDSRLVVRTCYNFDRGLDVDLLLEYPTAKALYDFVVKTLN